MGRAALPFVLALAVGAAALAASDSSSSTAADGAKPHRVSKGFYLDPAKGRHTPKPTPTPLTSPVEHPVDWREEAPFFGHGWKYTAKGLAAGEEQENHILAPGPNGPVMVGVDGIPRDVPEEMVLELERGVNATSGV